MQRVARRGKNHDIPAASDRHRFRERPERPAFEADQFRLPPLRPAMRQIALKTSADSVGALEFSLRHPDTAAGDVTQSTSMVRVKMRQHDLPHVAEADAKRAQLRPKLLFGMY